LASTDTSCNYLIQSKNQDHDQRTGKQTKSEEKQTIENEKE
jgi:hypothetical protein